MPKRRKDISATQSKLTSRRLRTATLGTHVPKPRSSRHMNGEGIGLSSSRKQRRAARGFVSNVLPTPDNAPSARRSFLEGGLEFSPGIRRRAWAKRILIVLVCLAAVAGVALGVGSCVYLGSVDGKIALQDSNASSALIAASADEPFYVLVAADLDEAGQPGAQAGPDALALARIDEASGTVSLVSIPADLRVTLSDGKTHQLRDAAASGEDDAALISAVASFAGVSVAHYVTVDAQGLVALVDALGGVEVNVAQDVDDPAAGDVYIPAGTQTLDGAAALTLARATNFAEPEETQAANQRALLASVAHAAARDGGSALLSLVDQAGRTFSTDMGASDVRSLADALAGVDPSAVDGALVPGTSTSSDGTDYYVASTTRWSDMMGRMQAGETLAAPAEQTASVDPGSFTVTVRNGGGVTGAAAQIADALAAQGFDVAETGNADTAVYDETLIVYDDEAQLAAANTVLEALGSGRVVQGLGYYTYDTDVLVVLGKDWKPLS